MSKKKVALLVGEDVTAQLMMNKVVRAMLDSGYYEPVIYLPKSTHFPSEDAQELLDYAFFEKKLLQGSVYPFLKQRPSQCATNLSPDLFGEQYGLHVEAVDDINAPAFVAKMDAADDIACTVSVRCTQLLRRPIWAALKKHGPVLNIHSGLLPDYRGVMPTMRRMFDIHSRSVTENDYGMTLHQIDPFDPMVLHKGIDTGKIIDLKSIELNPKHSGFHATVALADAGAEAIINALTQLQHGYTLRGYPQAHETSAYYSFPTKQELNAWKDNGVVLVRADEVIDTLVAAFSKAGTPHGNKLTGILEEAIKQRFGDAACGCDMNVVPCSTVCVSTPYQQRILSSISPSLPEVRAA